MVCLQVPHPGSNPVSRMGLGGGLPPVRCGGYPLSIAHVQWGDPLSGAMSGAGGGGYPCPVPCLVGGLPPMSRPMSMVGYPLVDRRDKVKTFLSLTLPCVGGNYWSGWLPYVRMFAPTVWLLKKWRNIQIQYSNILLHQYTNTKIQMGKEYSCNELYFPWNNRIYTVCQFLLFKGYFFDFRKRFYIDLFPFTLILSF